MKTTLAAPCGNCPFLKVGAIELRPGRLRQIKRDLLNGADFICHKTVSGEYDDEEEERNYVAGERDKRCAGAAIFLLLANRPTQLMRIEERLGMLDVEGLLAQKGLIA